MRKVKTVEEAVQVLAEHAESNNATPCETLIIASTVILKQVAVSLGINVQVSVKSIAAENG